MEKGLAALLAACTLLLTACAGWAMSEQPSPALKPERAVVGMAPQAEADCREPAYEVVPFTAGNQAKAEDGTVLALYNYQTVRLALDNEDALSPEDAAAAARNVSAFNEKMESVTADLVAQGEELARYAGEDYEAFGGSGVEYEDDAETTAVFTGDIVSVCLRRYSFTGGAHFNGYVLGWLFDLAAGQFILDPSQLADDPKAFHDGAAELLIAKADSGTPGPGGYWDDYRDIIRSGPGGVTLFDEEGMTVIYAPYELGPYAIGEVELHLSWEELGPLLGQSGMARLGRGE